MSLKSEEVPLIAIEPDSAPKKWSTLEIIKVSLLILCVLALYGHLYVYIKNSMDAKCDAIIDFDRISEFTADMNRSLDRLFDDPIVGPLLTYGLSHSHRSYLLDLVPVFIASSEFSLTLLVICEIINHGFIL